MDVNSVNFFKQNRCILPEHVLPPIIVAWKLRTPQNYGNILRLADNVGCRKVFFVVGSGEFSDRKIKKTARHSWDEIDFEFVEEAELLSKIPSEYHLVALETAETATNIFKTQLPANMVLVVGNEKAGIPSVFIDHCSYVVHIPITGNCTSLNVTHATSVALFEWMRQQMF